MGKGGKKQSRRAYQCRPMLQAKVTASLQCPSETVHQTNSPPLEKRRGEGDRWKSFTYSKQNPEIKQEKKSKEKLIASQQASKLITGLRTGTPAKGQSLRRQASVRYVTERDRVLGVKCFTRTGETGKCMLTSPEGEADQRRWRDRYKIKSDRLHRKQSSEEEAEPIGRGP